MEESGHPSCESDTSTHLQGSGDAPMSTINLYATLGLSPEDVDALAQIPESEISVETLPILIMQLKAKRAQEEARQRDVSPKREIKKDHADSRDDRGWEMLLGVGLIVIEMVFWQISTVICPWEQNI